MHIFSIILILDQLTGFNNLQKRFTVYIQHTPPPPPLKAVLFYSVWLFMFLSFSVEHNSHKSPAYCTWAGSTQAQWGWFS